jgi:16S rRNA (guanine527-N7)-methyltransferase
MLTDIEKPLSEATIRHALGEFQVTVNDEQILRIQRYIKILRHWNEKLNLTAIREPLEIYRHFASLCSRSVQFLWKMSDPGIDGPGFPGLPMKILRPEIELFLVEANIKKGTFLAEVVRELELSNARVLINRYEDLGEDLAPLDYVCSRAVGEFGPFLEWAASDRVSASNVILWIGGRDPE